MSSSIYAACQHTEQHSPAKRNVPERWDLTHKIDVIETWKAMLQASTIWAPSSAEQTSGYPATRQKKKG